MTETPVKQNAGIIARSFKLAVQLVGVLAIGLIIVGGILAWRLTSGPVSIAFLTPYFETALSSRTGSYVIDVDDTILKWVGGDRAVDLVLRGAQVLSPEGQMFAQVPELSVSLSAPALMRGEIAPKSLFISGARISVIRNIDGSLGIELPRGQRSGEGFVARLLEEFARTSSEEAALRELSRVEIDSAAVSIDDRQMGIVWRAPKANITLNRGKTGLVGQAKLDLELGSEMASLSINGSFLAANREVSLSLGFADVSPARIAGISKEFASLKHFDGPVTGSVALRVTLDGVVESVDFDLESQAGQFRIPEPFRMTADVQKVRVRGAFDQARSLLEIENLNLDLGADGVLKLPAPINHQLPVRGISTSARYWIESEKLEIDSLIADLAGPKIELTAVVQEIADELSFELNGTALAFNMGRLKSYWPEDLGKFTRDWVLENISEGTVPTARAKIGGRWNAGEGITVDTLIGDMTLEDLTVDYLSPLPPATNASGTAKFNRKTFEIEIDRGQAPGLTVNDGRIIFTGLEQFDQFADIDLTISGSLKSALELIDSKPLEFAKEVDLSPEDVSGSGEVRLKLDFLIERATSADDVKVLAEATLNQVGIPDIVLGHDLTEGRLRLKATNDGLTVSGPAKIASHAVELEWREFFDEDAEERAQYALKASVDASDFRAVTGLHDAPFNAEYLSGNLDVNLTMDVKDDGSGRVNAGIDLTGADLSFPQLDWRKSARVESVARVSADFTGKGLSRVSSFELSGGGIEILGDAVLSEGQTQTINVAKFRLGGTDIAGQMVLGKDDWQIDVTGSRLDISAFLDQQESLPTPIERGPSLQVDMDIGRVQIEAGKFLHNVRGSMTNDGWVWSKADLIANVDGGNSLAVELTPQGGKRTLSIGSDDAGAVLKGLGYYENIVGGKLALKAEYEDMTPESKITGQVLIEDFRLVDAPVLARLLSVASITGIPGELAGAGLSFQQLAAPFTKEAGMVHIKDAKAGGFNLGITANGTIDTELETLDIKGSVAPLDKLNSLLGNIPLFGVFFSAGEKGGGVFAADYSMKGSFDDPEISTNPLSALTPGIFRKIFDAFPERRPPTGGEQIKDFDPAK